MKRLGSITFVLATLAVLLTPSTAWAAKEDCNSNRLCLWHDSQYGGTLFSRTDSDDDLGSNSDEAHSVYNNTSVAWILYDDANFDDSDRHFCIKAGKSASNLGNSAYSFGDKISSVQRRSNNNCPSGVPQI